MKKMFLLGALFAVGLGFTACSSDKDVAENNGPIENGGGNYITVSINLPTATEAMTRAADTDNNGDVTFDDGLPAEYAVNNVSLLIFGSDGNFKEAYELDADGWTKVTASGTDYKNVTEYSKKFVVKTGNVAVNDSMLVVLNRQSLFSITGTSVMIGGSVFSGSFKDFCEKTTTTAGVDASTMTSNGFYMANAPLANVAGSGTTLSGTPHVRILVPVTATYDTQKAAEDATSCDQIYVERGMAKVTVDGTSTSTTFTNSKTSGSATISFSVSAWSLDNTNPTSYFVRSLNGQTSFHSLKSTKSGSVCRYIGNSQINIPETQTYGYRTYFAKSYGYDALKTLNRVSSTSDFKATGDDYPQYCFENTFPVSLQNVNNTTLAQLEVTATVAGSTNLYTKNGVTDVVYTDAEIQTLIQDAAETYISGLEGETGDLIKEKGSGFKSTDFGVDVSKFTRDADGKLSTIVITYVPSSGYATLKDDAFVEEGGSPTTTLTPAVCSAIFATITDAITEYVGGKSYYYVRIKHFGDNLTPWNDGETPTPSSTAGVYPSSSDQANNYLGRYGVLRNNWYNIKVKSIKSLGSAVPITKDYPNTPDDELDQYITFQINVLSWAKRPTQEAEL